jgi:replicative DNA helicase
MSMAEAVADHRRTEAYSAAEALSQLDDRMRSGTELSVRCVPTGFEVLDDVLGGGMRAGELILVGGPPGVGKTIVALQWARAAALAGQTAVFACYEHEPTTLLVRLLALEAGEAGVTDGSLAKDLTDLLAEGNASRHGLQAMLENRAGGSDALERLRKYADRLVLVRASGAHTTIEELDDLVCRNEQGSDGVVLFVDYLQKIPVQPEPSTEAEKVTRTVEALKDLALDRQVPVVLISAVDAEGMRSSRLRLYHLRGSSAIAFESDAVMMMNSKEKAVSKIHLSYDPVRARGFRDWVIMSIEKNRGGPNLIDLEFRKDFRHFRFDPTGGMVSERLVDERSDEHGL